MAELIDAVRFVVAPRDTQEAAAFYVVWMTLFLAVNVVWDAVSSKTPAFHLADLAGKVPTLWSAATFASSVMLLSSIFDPGVRAVVDATGAPIALASLSGLLVSVTAVCPYAPSRAKS